MREAGHPGHHAQQTRTARDLSCWAQPAIRHALPRVAGMKGGVVADVVGCKLEATHDCKHVPCLKDDKKEYASGS